MEAENLHFTLKFLGHFEESRVESIAVALRTIARAHAPFDLELSSVGAFPNLNRPRVVWLGTGRGDDHLMALQAEVEDAMVPLGFPVEERKGNCNRLGRAFTPHLTLGRIKQPRPDPDFRALLETAASTRVGTTRVEMFSLMQSILSPKGPTYTHLEDFRLTG